MLSGQQLIEAVPEIKKVANVRVEQVVNVPSYDLSVKDWLTLARRINTIFSADQSISGIVVTHGTSVLEETAYFLNLTVRDSRPVVVVGAMRPATAISADGPVNLLNAVRTAVDSQARDKGVLVVLNDEINAARDVTKTDTRRLQTFRSDDLGLLGYVDEDEVVFYRSSTRRHTVRSEFDAQKLQELPRVEILYSYVDADEEGLNDAVRRGARGIVFAGTGGGSLTERHRAAIKALRASATAPAMVIASRVGNGRVLVRTDYDALGLIPADNLNAQKARILLMLALTRTTDARELRRMFREY